MRHVKFRLLGKEKDSLANLLPVIGIFVFLISCTMLLPGCSSSEDEDIQVTPKDNSPKYNQSDIDALLEIYDSIGPWHDPWDLNDKKTWDCPTFVLDSTTNEYRVWAFAVYNGRFHGNFPKAFGKLTELRILILSGGALSGALPNEIGNLKKLRVLILGNNFMSGPLPDSIGNLHNLERLSLNDIPISGKLPETMGNLDSLNYLDICGTNITGTIPSSFKNLKKLGYVWLSDNKFCGKFPIEALKKNVYFNCRDNNFTELPFEVWSDSLSCAPPDLQHNNLSGKIPEWVFKTKKWKRWGYEVGSQLEGYGYSNYVE
nr:hypothetical protein [Prevotella sp.]